ncbi:protein PTHB1 [Aphidius gifuensis]|uniref:protein PTHB1 n=1 Tax=Aphidius gifuensis TaxID=684658 RepID=UPI001CDC6946|nr:protein PTHB1 [Aphidius gifuensis]
MSLFRTKEWWHTECGINETFDNKSLLVVSLFGDDKKDVVIVSSHSGNLRIYSPSSEWDNETGAPTGYKTTDLVIEAHIANCIIDTKVGKFVSGSQDLRLGILTPNKLLVYSVTLTPGSTEHGDRCVLEIIYSHELSRFPVSLVSGSFGAVKGRDFFCVQCIDGTLLFYEQEAPTFTQTLKDRLLPEKIAYISNNDIFITTSPGRILECYRYQNMAEFSRKLEENKMKNEDKILEPDWIYNISENVLGIETVVLSSFEIGIIVLTEKHIYCFRDDCSNVKYVKRLDYTPMVFRAFVIEPDGKLMVLVVADTDTLLVYEGTTLKWSAQLPFTPVAIARANFQNLEGVVVILSDDGKLEACYLGAEPSLFVAPPIHRRGFDYAQAEKELIELRRLSKIAPEKDDKLTIATMESELLTTIKTSLEPINQMPIESTSEEPTIQRNICTITIELSSYILLHDVQLSIDVLQPLVAHDKYHVFSVLRDKQIIQSVIKIEGNKTAISSEANLTIVYETDVGGPRVVQKIIQLPLRLIFLPTAPENQSSFSIIDEIEKKTSNAIGLRHINTNNIVTIVAGTNTNRYRVQSNDSLSITIVVQQLIARLRKKSSINIGNIIASIGQNHLQLLQNQIDTHFVSRQQVKRISKELTLLTNQLRMIEKGLLKCIRDKSIKPLESSGISVLLESTYSLMFTHLDKLEEAQLERENAAHNLQCAVKLLLFLIRPNISDDKYSILESAIGFEPQLRDDVDWEEVADVALFTLLRVTSKKPESEPSTRQLSWNKLETIRDLAKLKKRLVHAIERLNKPTDTVQEDVVDENPSPRQ